MAQNNARKDRFSWGGGNVIWDKKPAGAKKTAGTKKTTAKKGKK